MALCLFSFISLVWLKDQLSTGESPVWLTNDRNTARLLHEEELKRKVESRNEALNASAAFKRSKQDSPERVALNRDLQQLESQIQVCDVTAMYMVILSIKLIFWCTPVYNTPQLHCTCTYTT